MDSVESKTSINKKPAHKEAVHPTNQQKCMLIELLVDNDVLKMPLGKERLDKWKSIAKILNSVKGGVRTARQWKSTWANLRKRAKHGIQDYLKNISEDAQKLLTSEIAEWDAATDEQKCALLELLVTNNVFETLNIYERLQKWQLIACELNAMEGPIKTARQWKNTWANMRTRAKNGVPKYLANISEDARKLLISEAAKLDFPTDEQKCKLLELLVAHEVPKIQKSEERLQKWELITKHLNGMGGAVKTTRQWINTWTHMRVKAKNSPPEYITNITEEARELLLGHHPLDNTNFSIAVNLDPPTDEQKCMFVELLVANDVFTTTNGRECLDKWDSIAEELNSMTGIFRTTKQWKNTWWQIKKRTASKGLPDYLKNISKGARRLLLLDEGSTSEAAEQDSLPFDVTALDGCCDWEDETKLGHIGNRIDYCRQLIRAVSTGIRDNKNVEEVLSDLCKKPHLYCKKRRMWNELKTLTVNKLQYLLEVSDRSQLLAPEHRMTLMDWLLFDTVLIHLDVDVIGISDTNEKKILRDLFHLVVEHNVEALTGDELADAWSMITLKYNKNERQCTPMLLQRRWYQMKFATRARYCKFWSLYKNSKVPPDCVHQPSQLQKEIAMWHKSLLVEPFMMWEDLIKNNRVILREQFELIALNRRPTAKNKNQNPAPILTIDLDGDETETNIDKNNQPSTSTATNTMFNQIENQNVLDNEVVEPVLPIITNIYGNVTTENLTDLYQKPKDMNESINIANTPIIYVSPQDNTMRVFYNIKATTVLSNSLAEVPVDSHLAGEGVRLLDDGSKLDGEEIPMEIKYEVKTEDQVPTDQYISENPACTGGRQLERLLQVPIVYTVKLDDMGILPITLLHHVDNKGIIDIIEFKSKPSLKRLTKKQITPKSDVKTLVKQSDVKTVVKESEVKTVVKQSDVKTVFKQSDVKTVVKQSDVKTVVKQSDVKTQVKQSDVKTVFKQSDVQTVVKQSDVQTVVKQSDVQTIVKRVKLSSPLFQKPRYCTYPDIKLRKNPDFNVNILFNSSVGKLFSKKAHNILYRNCKPLTVDLSKEFEKELVNGRIYLDTTEDTGLSSTCAENNVFKRDVRYVNVYNKYTYSIPRIRKVTSLAPMSPANPSVISENNNPNVTNAFKPINLNDILSEVSQNLNAILPKSNKFVDNAKIKSKTKNPANVLSDVDHSYIGESLPSLEAVGSILSIFNDGCNEKKSTIENPEIECRRKRVLNISNSDDTNMINMSKPGTYQTSEEKEFYTDEEINKVLKRALMTLNIETQNPVSSYISEDFDTQEKASNATAKHVVGDYPKIDDQNSKVISAKDNNTEDLVNDILKKAVDSDLLQDSTFQQTSLKLNADLFLDIQKNSSSSKSVADIGNLALPFKSNKPDATLGKLYLQSSKSTNKILNTDNQVSDKPQESGKNEEAYKKTDEISLRTQKLKKDSLYSYIGSKTLQKTKHTRNKDTTYCCWASQRINDLKTKCSTVSRHKCPYSNCSCCCRDSLTKFKYFSENLIATSGSAENVDTRIQLDISVTIKQEPDLEPRPDIESNLASNMSVPTVTASSSSAYSQTETSNISSENTVPKPIEVKIKTETITDNTEMNKSNAECTFSHNNLIGKIIQKEYSQSSSMPSKSMFSTTRKPFSSMFVGKNNVLLTTAKLPPNLSKFKEFMNKLKQTIDLPKYIQLKLLPTGRVTLYRHPDFEVSEELLEKLTYLVDEFYQENGDDERNTTSYQSNKTSIKKNLTAVGEKSSETAGNVANTANNVTSKNLTKSHVHKNLADITPISQKQTTETPREQDKIDVYTEDDMKLIQSRLGHIFSKVLTPVTNMTDLKYAYSNKGLFFKFNLKTNILHPMNICIKRKTNKGTLMDCAKPTELSSNYLSHFSTAPLLKDILIKNPVRKDIVDLKLTANKQVKPFNPNILKSTHSDAITRPDDSQETINEKAKRKYDQIASSGLSDKSSEYEPLAKIKVRKDIQNIEIINASKLTSIVQEFVKDQDKNDTNNVSSDDVQVNDLVTKNNNSAVSDNVIYVLTNVLLSSQPLDKTNNCAVIDDKKQTKSNTINVSSDDHADDEPLNKSTTVNIALNDVLSGERLNESNVNNIPLETHSSPKNKLQNANTKSNLLSRLTFEDELQNENEATIVPSDDLLERKCNTTNVSSFPDSKSQNESNIMKTTPEVTSVEEPQNKNNTNTGLSDNLLDGDKNIKSNTLPEDLFDTDSQMESYIDNASSDDSVDSDILDKSNTDSVSAEDFNSGDLQNTNNTSKDILDIDSEQKNNCKIDNTSLHSMLDNTPLNKSNLNYISPNNLFNSEQQSEISKSNVSPKDCFGKESQNNENIVSSDRVRADHEQNNTNESIVSSNNSHDDRVQNNNSDNMFPSDKVLADNVQNSNENIVSPNNVPADFGQNNNNENIVLVDNIRNEIVQNNSNENIISSDNIPDDRVQNNSKINNVPFNNCLNSESNNKSDNKNNNIHKSIDNISMNEIKTNNNISGDGSKNETNINAAPSLNLLDSESQNNSNTNNVLPVACVSSEPQNKNNTTSDLFDNSLNVELQNKTHSADVSSNDLGDKNLLNKNNIKSVMSNCLLDEKLHYKCTVDLITLQDLLGGEPPNNRKESSILPDDFFDSDMPNNVNNTLINNDDIIVQDEKQNKSTDNVAHEEKQNKSKNKVPQSKKQNKDSKSNVKPNTLNKRKRKKPVSDDSEDEPLVNVKKRIRDTSKSNEAQVTKKVGYIEITHHHPIEVIICISSGSDSEHKEEKVSNKKKVIKKKKLKKAKKKPKVDLPLKQGDTKRKNNKKYKKKIKNKKG